MSTSSAVIIPRELTFNLVKSEDFTIGKASFRFSSIHPGKISFQTEDSSEYTSLVVKVDDAFRNSTFNFSAPLNTEVQLQLRYEPGPNSTQVECDTHNFPVRADMQHLEVQVELLKNSDTGNIMSVFFKEMGSDQISAYVPSPIPLRKS